MTLAELIDEAVEDRVLAFSPLPPEGRDVDLLVRPAEELVIASLLRAEGFLQKGWEWARFRGCSAEGIDLVPAESLDLPGRELERLFAEARPIEGMRTVVRPAPHHFLLLLARYTVEGDGTLPEKRRIRIARALAENPGAWAAAAERAPDWASRCGLPALRRAYEEDAGFVPPRERARARAERLAGLGWNPQRARLRAWRELLAQRPRRGRLISFSGLDGAGKTSQAEALRETLERLGFDTEIAWTRLEWTTLWENRWLGVIGWPARAAVGRLARLSARRGEALRERAAAGAPQLTPGAVRERSELLSQLWVSIIAFAHASAQRRAVRLGLRRGRVVICDRYTLDAAVQLRFLYGERRRFRLQTRLLDRFSPRPLSAYLVDVSAETAHARKPEQYDLAALSRQARLYRELAVGLGAIRVDGERPRNELCSAIAERVWRALDAS
jgi:thymidylate kinase